MTNIIKFKDDALSQALENTSLNSKYRMLEKTKHYDSETL